MVEADLSLKSLKGEAKTILVVDDNDMIRSLALDILKHQGYTVIEANNGYSALAISACWTEPIDLVLTDVIMPNLNGIEFIERLRFVRNDFKVLYMSAYLDDVLSHRGIPAREVAFIRKPFRVSDLLKKVQDLFGEQAR